MAAARPPVLALILGLLAAAGGGCDRTRHVARVLQVTPSASEVDEEGMSQGIRLTFDRAVAPRGKPGRAVSGPALRISPPLAGEARWLDAVTLAFFPRDRLRPSTAYDVKLDPGLALGANVQLASWTGTRFVYRRIVVEQPDVDGPAHFMRPLPVVTVTASLPIRPEEAARACAFYRPAADGKLGDPTPLRPVDGATVGRTVRLTPTRPLPAATAFGLRCAGLVPADGGEAQAGEQVRTVATHGAAGVAQLAPIGRDVSADAVKLEVKFATPMNPADVRAHVHLATSEGQAVPLELAGDASASTFRWTGDLRPATAYRITVDGGLKDIFGQEVGAERTHDFQVGDASPRLRMDRGIFVVERASGRLPIWTRNLPKFQVRCAPVAETSLAAVLTGPANYDAWWDAGDPKPIDYAKLKLTRRERTVDSAGTRNQWFDAGLPLRDTCGGHSDSGVYLLEVASQAAPREQRSLISVTDLGLLAKVGNASSLIWVVRLSTGRPVPDAAVRVRDLKGQVRFSGTSNADGVVLAPGATRLLGLRPAASEEEVWENYRARRVVVTARAGDDLAVLDTNWNNGIQVWNFGVEQDRGGGASRVRGFLHSDRGLYRPGDTVHLRGLVRRIDLAGRMSVPRGRKIQLLVEDPRGATLLQQELPITAYGGFARDVPLSAEARLGDYQVRAEVDGQRFSERFSVEEYRPRTFEVKVATPRKNVFVGEKLQFALTASYLYGSPLRGGKTSWSVRRRAHRPAFDGFDGYSFQDLAALWDSGSWWARDEDRSFSDPVGDGELTLDATGQGTVVTVDPTREPAGPQDYLFEATVQDASGDQVTAGQVVAGHRANLYLGLHPSEFVQAVDMPFGVQVVAFDAEGKRRAAEVELTLTARRYQCGGDGPCRSQSAPQPALRRKLAVPAAGSAAVERVTLPDPGEYVVRVAGPDGRGGEAVSTEVVYLIGKGEAFWSGDEGDRMTVIASKPRYQPGETARLVPQAQLPGALALVTLERDGILSYALEPLATSGEAIEVPIEPRLAPNVFASVALVRGRTGAGDAGRPRFRMGVVDLVVDASHRRLRVAVETDRPAYQPGDPVRARVRVTGADGKPARAELALAVADEGVLQILGFRTPDPFPAFYAPWGLGVESATTWNRLLLRRDPNIAEDEGGEGGDAGGDQAGRVRSRFMATAFWAPALVTDARGVAEVSFTAPDNLTAYRVMAVAADAGDRFGAGEQRLSIRQPLQVMPALPRFLSVGDQLEAAAVVHNNTDDPLDVEVALTARGLELTGAAAPTRVKLAARGLQRVAFAARAGQPGEAVVTFRATAGALRDAVEVKLPVDLPSTPEVLLVGEGSTSSRVQHALPALGAVVPDRGALEVTLDRTGLARLDEGMRYLVGYPYGCVEQTTSKLVPMVALTELAKIIDLKEVSAAAARAFVETGIAKVLRHQHEDGGFGLWPGTPPAVHYSAYALWGLQVARAGGYAVDGQALESGARYLSQRLAQGKQTGASAAEALGERGDEAFAVYVLATLGHQDAGRLSALFERRAQLPVFGRAFLARALQVAQRRDLAATLASELAALAPAAGPALIREGEADLGWYWSSDLRSTALVLAALLEIAPTHPAVPRLAEALLTGRVDGRWASTQENLYSVLALAELGKARAAAGAVTATVRVGAQVLGRQELSGRAPVRLRLPLERVGPVRLTIESQGGELFYAARLHVERPFDPSALTAHGLSVERALLDPTTGTPLQRLKLGQVARVRLRITSADRLAHVAVVDRLPAGLEPVLTRFHPSFTDGEEGRSFWWERWETAWQQQELKDDRARMFADVLAAGESEQAYLVRAVAVGTFAAPSTTVEAMYRPDIKARGQAATLVVER
jgi:uncharacterized protein YfaS (alpha-2-macroglobulin family)